MSTVTDVVQAQLHTSGWLLEQMTADLSGDEFFRPATPGSNHAAWIVGHIATSEDNLIAQIRGQQPVYTEEMRNIFGGQSACEPDASKYPPVKDIHGLFQEARARTLQALEAFDVKRWDDPSPEGLPREFFPTIGSVWGLVATHPFWHIGQLTTCRVALGKKRVLG